MMVMMNVVVALLLIVQLAAAGRQQEASLDLNNLCNGADMELPVRGLDLLLDDFEEGDYEHNCPQHVKTAMLDLKRIIDVEEACTMDKAQAIVNYANTYLKEPSKIPKALAKLAVSYGMQVKDSCQWEAVNSFLYFTETQLSNILGAEASVKLVKYIADKNPLSLVLTPIVKGDEVVLPEDLYKVLPGLEQEVDVFVSNSEAMQPIKRMCANLFQPLYEPMLLPLAHLQRAGFNEGHTRVETKLRKLARFWTVTTFLCEIVKKSALGQVDAEKAELIEDLTADLTGKSSSEPGADRTNKPPQVEVKTVQRYNPKTKFGRNNLDKADQTSLRVHSFDANKDEADHLRDKIAERSFQVFKMMSRKGTHLPFIKKMIRMMKFKKDSSDDLEKATTGLVDLMQAKEEDSMPFKIARGLRTVGLAPFKLIGAVLLAMLQLVGCFCGALANEADRGSGGGNLNLVAFSAGMAL